MGFFDGNWRDPRSIERAQNRGDVIPTWDVGQEQPQPNDILKFAKEGYAKNSLIYSCVKEKATSFASLLPIVIRRDGAILENHRAVQLLRDPNPHQDGQEFAEILKTQFEAAGNAYIQKVRTSGNAARRQRYAGWPVQELQLIRPDYVTIEPGVTPDRDVFLVTVGGSVKRRVPRADMIHIAEPNLINDFYGLSKIALLVREGSIDLSMSDFEYAFFRNAGVPMGMLSVKGRISKEQTDEVKSRFRQAYNSIKGWFDLLVLNADTTTYTPLGLKQADMEMDSTRFHVESRICSVFGVPGIIVGARYALQEGGALADYEKAEHAFWAETMVPDTLRIARAWTKSLLAEFATSQDAGAQVSYDFTVVRALQEDRSRKLREVVRMINTGAFTVNQALTINGMPSLPDGDFYIRTGNQVTVRPAADGTETIVLQPSPGGGNPANPLEGAARLNGHRAEAQAAVAEALSIFKVGSGDGDRGEA